MDAMTAERTMEWVGISGEKYKYWVYPIGTSFDPVPGNYIFARETSPNTWIAIYAGETDNLASRLNNPNLHEKWPCICHHDWTHIHSHRSVDDSAIRQKEESDIKDKWYPPCNLEY
jgi:hypothetical protein